MPAPPCPVRNMEHHSPRSATPPHPPDQPAPPSPSTASADHFPHPPAPATSDAASPATARSCHACPGKATHRSSAILPHFPSAHPTADAAPISHARCLRRFPLQQNQQTLHTSADYKSSPASIPHPH